jgi:hypothetical protein
MGAETALCASTNEASCAGSGTAGAELRGFGRGVT